MNERRIDPRKLLNTRFSLYHPVLGKLEGKTRNISDGGISVELNDLPAGELSKHSDDPLFFRPLNIDVLFPVSCLRQSDHDVVLKFLD